MAKTDDKVMDLVEDEIRKNPDVATTELFEKAKNAVSSIGKLTLRQFNARYPLQIKRRMAMRQDTPKKRSAPRRAGGRRKARRAPEAQRDQVRQVMLKFAADLSAAEERKDLVKVLAGVDDYVDQVLKAAS